MELSRAAGQHRSSTQLNIRTTGPIHPVTPLAGPVVSPFTATIPRQWPVPPCMGTVTPAVTESANPLPVICPPRAVSSVSTTQRRCLTLRVTVCTRRRGRRRARITRRRLPTAVLNTLIPRGITWASMEGASPWTISWTVILTLMLTATADLNS